MIEEVVAFAKKGCSLCRHSVLGPGQLRITVKDHNDVVAVRHEVCNCAFDRFRKANPGLRHDPRTGVWYWPPKRKEI